MRREVGTELQTDSREPQDNQGGVLGENANNGRVKEGLKIRPSFFIWATKIKAIKYQPKF
ncbi:MAG: hypothetical protein IKC33_00690 [Clostridia bacterium]|nr:hypothetical protein [Clostridia bacterium]